MYQKRFCILYSMKTVSSDSIYSRISELSLLLSTLNVLPHLLFLFDNDWSRVIILHICCAMNLFMFSFWTTIRFFTAFNCQNLPVWDGNYSELHIFSPSLSLSLHLPFSVSAAGIIFFIEIVYFKDRI